MNTTATDAAIRADFPDVDVADADTFAREMPHAYFARLRAEAPVYWHEPKVNIRPFWVITRYEDIREMSRRPQDFSSWRGGTNIEDYAPEDLEPIQQLLVNMDPPQHVKFRKLVSMGFTPRMVKLMEGKIQAEVAEILDHIAPLGGCDFVREVAAELPLRIIAELLGAPREDRGLIFDWSNRLIGFDDPEFQTSLEDGRMAAMEIWQYAQALVDERTGQAGDDLVRVLLNAEVDGEKISEAEFNGFFLLLSVAGNETTRNAISHGMQAFLDHPDQWPRLKANPDLIDSAVEEIVRWATPVMYFRRTVTHDLEFRGVQMKEIDKLAMYYSSANNDESVFTNPRQFDVGRTPNDHIAFGYGQHFCLGANLARLEIKVLLQELLRRFDRFEQAGPVRRLRSNFINGIKSMPVTYKLA